MSEQNRQSDGGAKPWGKDSVNADTTSDDGGAVLETAAQKAAAKTGPIRLSEAGNAGGIKCPNCHCKRLVDAAGPGWEKARMAVAKTQQKSGSIQRDRVCSNCGCRVTTRERIVGEPRMPASDGPVRLSDKQ